MARNRKRAKERRARRPQPVATARERDDATPSPMAHAAPDVELAEAQLAVGRPDLAPGANGEPEPEPEADELGLDPEDTELGLEPESAELGLEPESAELGLEPESAELGLEPESAELGLEPESAGDGRDGGFSEATEDEFDGAGPSAARGGALAVPAASTAERAPRSGNRLVNFLQGSWRELQRVQWPDRRQVMQATGVVIGFVIVAGVFLGLADYLSQQLVTYILK